MNIHHAPDLLPPPAPRGHGSYDVGRCDLAPAAEPPARSLPGPPLHLHLAQTQVLLREDAQLAQAAGSGGSGRSRA